MQDTNAPIHTLNSLLRGELSAIETYQQALAKIGDANGATQLREIHQEHVTAANALREHVHQHGGQPIQRSGAWGTFAKAVEGTARLLGTTPALKVLEVGEKQGIRGYEKALAGPALDSDCQDWIRLTLLPQARAHVPALERLIAFSKDRTTHDGNRTIP